MKKILLTTVFMMSIVLSNAQWGCSCLPEGITFTTQYQIDSFATNYPACNEIEGDVIIGYDIANLEGLYVLTSIQGNLEFSFTNLTDLSGLHNLVSIGGDLYIFRNIILANLEGLGNLTSIGGNFTLAGNDSLPSLNGLESLTFIGGDLRMYKYYEWVHWNNPLLVNLEGLNGLESVGGGVVIAWSSSLVNLSGLDNLAHIGGSFCCIYNSSLVNFAGLESLTYIGGLLQLAENDSLINLAGLDNVSSIESLYIAKNENLASISELDSLLGDSITSIAIFGNPALSMCEARWLCEYLASPSGSIDIYNNAEGCNNPAEIASNCGIPFSCLPYGNYHCNSQEDVDNFQLNYPGCTELAGDFLIHGNSSSSGSNIENLEGLSDIISVGGNLQIIDNEYLNSLNSLSNLTNIGGHLAIHGNDALENLEGLERLSVINGSLGIIDNISLVSLSSLIGINSVGGSISIISNDNLSSLHGLNNIDSIGGSFNLGWNNLLADITDIGGFTKIFGKMKIYNNPALTSLTGLEGLTSIGGGLSIYSNPLLSQCEVEAICTYLATPNGTVSIQNNAPGCNSEEEVEAACQAVSLPEFKVHSSKFKVEVYPNPFSEIVHIEFEIRNPSPVSIQVFNAVGELVADLSAGILAEGRHQILWNAANLPSGLYFVRLIAGKESAGAKLIKQ